MNVLCFGKHGIINHQQWYIVLQQSAREYKRRRRGVDYRVNVVVFFISYITIPLKRERPQTEYLRRRLGKRRVTGTRHRNENTRKKNEMLIYTTFTSCGMGRIRSRRKNE